MRMEVGSTTRMAWQIQWRDDCATSTGSLWRKELNIIEGIEAVWPSLPGAKGVLTTAFRVAHETFHSPSGRPAFDDDALRLRRWCRRRGAFLGDHRIREP